MVMPLKKERNKKLVEMRNKNPKKWSFFELGRFFHINKVTAYQVYQRNVAKNSKLVIVDNSLDSR